MAKTKQRRKQSTRRVAHKKPKRRLATKAKTTKRRRGRSKGNRRSAPAVAQEIAILRCYPSEQGLKIDVYPVIPPERAQSLAQSVGTQIERVLSEHVEITLLPDWLVQVLANADTLSVEFAEPFEHALDAHHGEAKRVLADHIVELVAQAIGGLEGLAQFRFANLNPNLPTQ